MVNKEWTPKLTEEESKALIKLAEKNRDKEHSQRVGELTDHISSLLDKKKAFLFLPEKTSHGEKWVHELSKTTAQLIAVHKGKLDGRNIPRFFENAGKLVEREHSRNKEGFLHQIGEMGLKKKRMKRM